MIYSQINGNLGIALSGGGARGIGHVGVLKALTENGIHPHYISGASMGSVVGAFYASGKTPEQMMDLFRHVRILKIFHLRVPMLGLSEMTFLRKILLKTLGKIQFEDLEKPFSLSVANLQTGEYEIIDSGDLIEAIVASSSIPLIFKPVIMNGMPYVDGGLINNLPVEPLEKKAKVIIGVSVVQRGVIDEPFDSFGEIATRCFALYNFQNIKPRLEKCDLVIEPLNKQKFHLFDFKNAEKIYQCGYEATLKLMPEILRVLGSQPESYLDVSQNRILNDGR